MLYRNEVSFEKLLKDKIVTTTLVDHHVLNEKDKILEPTVIQVLDHRPIDAASKWNEKEIEVIIKQVGSCSTLIADKILETNKQILFRELAYLIYGKF